MRSNIRVSATACIWCALMLLILPLQWVTAAISAALFHELCHILAIHLCGSKAGVISIGGGGAVMDAGTLSNSQELFCALAGPMGGLLLLLLARWLPRLALCALVHSVYNLIPVYPLDGGRALRCTAFFVFGTKSEKMFLGLERIICCLILLLGVYASCVCKLGPIPIFLVGFLIVKVNHGKIPCKDGRKRVQ